MEITLIATLSANARREESGALGARGRGKRIGFRPLYHLSSLGSLPAGGLRLPQDPVVSAARRGACSGGFMTFNPGQLVLLSKASATMLRNHFRCFLKSNLKNTHKTFDLLNMMGT